MARILIPTPLRQFAEKNDNVELPGASVGEVLGALYGGEALALEGRHVCFLLGRHGEA